MESRGCLFIHPENDLRCVLLRNHADYPHILTLEEAQRSQQAVAPWAFEAHMKERRCACGYMLASFCGAVQVCRCGRRYEVTIDPYKLLERIDELDAKLKAPFVIHQDFKDR